LPHQYNLGVMYECGHGVAKDEAKAATWLRRAAEDGDVLAQVELGHLHSEGRGVEQSDAKAFDWYEKAAEQGDPDAQYEVGAMFYGGKARGEWGEKKGDYNKAKK
jgi:TPR repeat protein